MDLLFTEINALRFFPVFNRFRRKPRHRKAEFEILHHFVIGVRLLKREHDLPLLAGFHRVFYRLKRVGNNAMFHHPVETAYRPHNVDILHFLNCHFSLRLLSTVRRADEVQPGLPVGKTIPFGFN